MRDTTTVASVPGEASSAIPGFTRDQKFLVAVLALSVVAAGFASILAGSIVVQTEAGATPHFDTLGFVMVATTVISFIMIFFMNRIVNAERRGDVVK